jgi:hypothetical protein
MSRSSARVFFLIRAVHFRFYGVVSVYVPGHGHAIATCSSGVGPNIYDRMACITAIAPSHTDGGAYLRGESKVKPGDSTRHEVSDQVGAECVNVPELTERPPAFSPGVAVFNL